MGYSTEYTLSYEIPKQTKSDLANFRAELKKKKVAVPSNVLLEETTIENALWEFVEQDDSCEYGSIVCFMNGDNEPCKWYGYEEDMEFMSKKFPTVLFKLEGKGEESGDLWIRYYRGGKCQLCKGVITYDKFDPKKLK